MNQLKFDVPVHMILWIALLIAGLFFAGCSHNLNTTVAGKWFRIGGEGCSITYANGLVVMSGTRENAESLIETNDVDGLGNPADVKAVRSIRYKVGPQISGYMTDLAKISPEAAIEYVKVMPQMTASSITPAKPETAKESSSIVQPILTKIKQAMGGDTAKVIVGDGEYQHLDKDRSIKYQSALCSELLQYANDEVTMESGEGLKSTLIHYAGRLGQLVAKGKSDTKMRISKATIRGGKLVYLIYVLEKDDGSEEEIDCPSCFEVED